MKPRDLSGFEWLLVAIATVSAGATVLAVGATMGWDRTPVLLLAPLVAGTLLLDVPVPLGGSVPLGYTLVIGLTEPLTSDRYALVLSLALLLAAPFVVRSQGRQEGARVMR